MKSPEVVVVGSGFGGWFAAKHLQKRLPTGATLTLVSPTDYLLYTPLLPAVATGVLAPRTLAIPLGSSLTGTRPMLGSAQSVDVDRRTVSVEMAGGRRTELRYDRLVLAPGSVTKKMPVPGLSDLGFGLKTLTQAQVLRDHVFAHLDLADAAGNAQERREHATFVIVGAGYAGTELAAQLKGVIDHALGRWRRLSPEDVRFLLVDASDRVMPELGKHLGDASVELLRSRGIDLRLGTTVDDVGERQVVLSDGETVPTRTLVWCAGVEPGPLVETLGLPLEKGRLVTDASLRAGGLDDVFAVGDAAAVPDLTRDGQLCPPTAQHAQRQGGQVARNVAASLGHEPLEDYKHHDLGLVVDFGRRGAAARPLGVPLTGLPAKAVTLGYHVAAVPTLAGRARVLADLVLAAALPSQTVQLRSLTEEPGSLAKETGTG